MDNKQLTEGQELVRASFNPSQKERVRKAKQLMADAVDLLTEVDNEVKANKGNADSNYGKFTREVAMAKTEVQKASWAVVGALTHDITFKYINEPSPIESKFQPHQQRVVDEKDELSLKYSNLVVFIESNPIYNMLPQDEQEDLKQQQDIMWSYVEVLQRRINRF